MIARPGRPGIHDGTEFALQGFKNPVGEAAAIAFSNSSRDNLTGALANIESGQRHDGFRICVPERRRFGNPTDDRFRGTSSGASQSAQGGSVSPPKSSERCSLPPIVWV